MKPTIGIVCDGHWGRQPQPTGSNLKDFFLNKEYVLAIAENGGIPLIVPYGEKGATPEEYTKKIDGLLLSGATTDIDPIHYGEEPSPKLGPINPPRTQFELELIHAALGQGLPILGICGGAQTLVVAFGGSLIQHLPDHPKQHPRESSVPIHSLATDPSSRLSRILGRDQLRVNSTHHQAANEVKPPLRSVAWADDGVIEAVEHDGDRFIIGVQWHPERLYLEDLACCRIFQAFIEAAKQYLTRHERR